MDTSCLKAQPTQMLRTFWSLSTVFRAGSRCSFYRRPSTGDTVARVVRISVPDQWRLELDATAQNGFFDPDGKWDLKI